VGAVPRDRSSAAASARTIGQMVAADKLAGRRSSKQYGQPPLGFPSKGQHSRAYTRLKERRIEEALRQAKQGHPRTSKVLFLSGIPRGESRRRAKREPLSGRRAAKFCSPLIDWTARDMKDYRSRFDLPESEVAALLHRSGECNCGAFAQAEDERKMMRAFWPEWWALIEALEAEAEARGIRWCRWGGYDLDGNQAAGSKERLGCSALTAQTGVSMVEEFATGFATGFAPGFAAGFAVDAAGTAAIALAEAVSGAGDLLTATRRRGFGT